MAQTRQKRPLTRRGIWLAATGPGATIVALGLLPTLLVDAMPPPGFVGGSTLGLRIWGHTYGWVPRNPATRTSRLIRAEGGILCLDPFPVALGQSKLSLDPSTEVLTISYSPVDEVSGFWAITRMYRRHRFEFAGSESFTAAELRLARLVYFDEVVRPFSKLDTPTLRRLPLADLEEDRALWWGYVHNVWCMAVLTWLVISLAWVPRVPAMWRWRRADKRRKHGLCPACGYSLAGLSADRCPECGAPAWLLTLPRCDDCSSTP